ncbi:MAG: DNA polymerase III subunit gamma/tau [Oscillospiraceae bacterium]|nr:DNA polymerase III subunit gamma/tau [Oscillospiraceae bacterium]
MYRALYRKWRPQTFGEVIGQEHITTTLREQVKNGRLSHAYLFIGTRGTGKTTCARILSRAVNCEHPVDGEPCGTCAACRGILDGSVVDVVELDAASNNGVDNVRALREEATFSPAMVKKRVYIIDEVHMLSMSAFNALLKILEEPPEHLMFILATTELHKVPATILSRCQRHSFRRVDAGKIARYLLHIAEQEHIGLTEGAADLIARLADGGVRDALSMLDQCSGEDRIDTDKVLSAMGLTGKRRVSELLDDILRHDADAALHLFAGMWMDGKDPVALLDELSTLLRDILMLHVSPKAGRELISGGFELGVLAPFAERMTTEEILAALHTLQDTLGTMRDVKKPRTAVELCLVSLCSDVAGDSIPDLRSRLSRLEEFVEKGNVPVRAVQNIGSDAAAAFGGPASTRSTEPEAPVTSVPAHPSTVAANGAPARAGPSPTGEAPAGSTSAVGRGPEPSPTDVLETAEPLAPSASPDHEDQAMSEFYASRSVVSESHVSDEYRIEDHDDEEEEEEPSSPEEALPYDAAGTSGPFAAEPADDTVGADDTDQDPRPVVQVGPAPDPELWGKILAAMPSLLPVDLCTNLSNDALVNCLFHEDQMILTSSRFMLERIERGNYKQRLMEAMAKGAGRPLRLILRNVDEQAQERRDVDELRPFKEVHFVKD